MTPQPSIKTQKLPSVSCARVGIERPRQGQGRPGATYIRIEGILNRLGGLPVRIAAATAAEWFHLRSPDYQV